MDQSRYHVRRSTALSAHHPHRHALAWRLAAPLLIAGIYYLLTH